MTDAGRSGPSVPLNMGRALFVTYLTPTEVQGYSSIHISHLFLTTVRLTFIFHEYAVHDFFSSINFLPSRSEHRSGNDPHCSKSLAKSEVLDEEAHPTRQHSASCLHDLNLL